jgi:hypothetical protein
VQIPNGIFKDLAKNCKNIQQTSFAYAYIIVIAFLYKYTHFVDIDNGTYIQNADIKEFLGYNRTTKSIDPIIKKNGILDEIGLTATVKDYPIRFVKNPTETINNIPLREFVHISDINNDDVNYTLIKSIVKNNNYTVKEPVFFFNYNDEGGTLYDYANTHKIRLRELMAFVHDDNLNNIDFLLYCFFKSKCHGYKDHTKAIGLHIIIGNLDIGKDAFYGHLNTLKDKQYVEVNHKGWVMGSKDSLDANEYSFKGVK